MNAYVPVTWILQPLTFCHILFLCLCLSLTTHPLFPFFFLLLFENKLQTSWHFTSGYFSTHLLRIRDFLMHNHKTVITLKKSYSNSTILFSIQCILKFSNCPLMRFPNALGGSLQQLSRELLSKHKLAPGTKRLTPATGPWRLHVSRETISSNGELPALDHCIDYSCPPYIL